MKKLICLLLLLNLSVGIGFAESITIKMDGTLLLPPQAPVITNGRVLVPARFLLESLGFTLNWNPQDKSISADKNGYGIAMKIGEDIATINGVPTGLDAAPEIFQNTTYVPLRFISEAAGAVVSYSDVEKSVSISRENLNKELIVSDPALLEALKRSFKTEKLTMSHAFYCTDLDLNRSGIRTLAGIEAFKNLKTLNLHQNQIGDIAPLKELMKLETLDLGLNKVQSLAPLTELNALKKLDISDNQLGSLNALNDIKALRELKIQNCGTTEYKNLYFIKDQLTALDIDKSKIERPDYDTPIVKNYASFTVPISKGVQWVPANRLGGSTTRYDVMQGLLKQSPETKRLQISSVYQLAQYLYENTWFKYENAAFVPSNLAELNLQIYPNGADILRMNRGAQVEAAIMTHYLLSGDYPESGFLLLEKESGKHILLNYFRTEKNVIRKNDKDEDVNVPESTYTVINAAAYLKQSGIKPAAETGALGDYTKSDGLMANITTTADIATAGHLFGSTYPDIKAVYQIKTDSDHRTTLAIGSVGGRLVLPALVEEKVGVLYKRDASVLAPTFREIDLAKPYFEKEPTFESYYYK